MTLNLKLSTVVETLYFEAKIDGSSRGITFIDDEGREERVSYVRVLEQAYAVAASLRRAGVAPREPVLVVVPTSPEFAFVFFGLLLAGAIPAPLPLPASFGDLEGFAERAAWVARYLGAKHAVTTVELKDVLQGAIPLVASELLAQAPPQDFAPEPVRADDVAMIQCTSASTGPPKGVQLTHENLISNVHQIGFCLGVREGDVPVCWLPLYHDMGLIGCLLFAIYWNLDSVFLSPQRFLRRPVSWLQAIARHRGSISPAPNFAYNYVTARARDEELANLDLSSFRIALCGAEPVNPTALDRFSQRFAKFGLPPHAPAPCYGLAEATLAVTFHPIGAPLLSDRVSRRRLAEEGVVAPPENENDAITIANCGSPMPETRVRIVDEGRRVLPEDRVGRIQVSGPTVMRGYHAMPEDNARVLADGWLDTGDLGYLRGGQLRVTGRAKDIVIVRGRNYAPTDFEWAAEEVQGIRKGNVVAFGVTDEKQGTEVLHLVCESDATDPAEQQTLREAVTAHVAARTGVAPAAIELVPRNTIPKTSSGKLQRSKMKERYLLARQFAGL